MITYESNPYLYLENYVNFSGIKVTPNSLLEYTSVLESIDPDEGYGENLRPVFVVLLYSDSSFDHIAEKFVKGQKYWHAAISFGPAISHSYSFNFGEANANSIKGGLSFESLDFYKHEHPTGTMEVSCVFLDKYLFNSLKDTFDYYVRNKEKTKYSFINLAYSLFGHSTKDGIRMDLVCCTFVDTILKSVGIDLSHSKSTNLMKPDDLMCKPQNKKQFKIYEGPIIGYDPEKATKKVEKLAQNEKNNYFVDKK